MLLSSSTKNCLISFLSIKTRFLRNLSDKAVSSLKIGVRSHIKAGKGFSISISIGGGGGLTEVEKGEEWMEEGERWREEFGR